MSGNLYKFKNIMVIDDNNIDLYIASKVISKNNFAENIATYSSAVEALEFLVSNEDDPSVLPEIILVDIYMPVMSGFEFMNAYDGLSQKVKEHCKAYIVSSTIDENDISRTQQDKNVVAFQEKPLTAEFLSNIKM
ncbi:MAG: response regulator [Flavobacterium sp.]|nr:MAG: response regulator [Flavobacterium sp.]